MKTKQDILNWLNDNQKQFTDISDQMWQFPEIAYQEFRSSKLLADILAAEGFEIKWDIGGMNTAFIAEWGKKGYKIGFIGEYDALAGFSQKNQPTKEAIEEGAPGHACGHNLMGTSCAAAAIGTKKWLEATGTEGIVRFYGCPAEERGAGKPYMAKDGAFDDLDIAIATHPGRVNEPSKESEISVYDVKFRFLGKAAHAGDYPHLGRSALDAVELMNSGVNYLREHVTDKVRMHYVITKGGTLPNVVPEEAEVWYFIRAFKRDELDEVFNRVRKIAEGAALMTETKVEETINGACSCMIANHHLADMLYTSLEESGPIQFTEEEKTWAATINQSYEQEAIDALMSKVGVPEALEHKKKEILSQPVIGEIFPCANEGNISTGSTDLGDVSLIAPTGVVYTACWATGATAHNWQIAATTGMSIGHKGMILAGKAMALAAIDLYSDVSQIEKAKAEFVKSTDGKKYTSPLPDHLRPPQFKNPYRS
jgi:aminobenzoyl-glutamate utilization protein B